MRKIVLSIYDCRPGMRIAETVYNEYGAVIVAENSIFDEHTLRKLENLDITRVQVFEESEIDIANNSPEEFEIQYKNNISEIKNVLHDISAGKNIDIDKVDGISNSIFVKINENRDIISCLNQIRNSDEYTYTHCVNVSMVSMLIGKWMKYTPLKIKKLIFGALLHDVGKCRVAPEIVNKPGPLTEEEYEEIKKHPLYGFRMVANVPRISKDIAGAILMHHERVDGSGYPMGARNEQIGEMARIVAVADIYDAMTSNRVYRPKKSPFDVFELMENNAFGYLDPSVMHVFLNNIAAYYIGDNVRLNNGEVGEIVHINPRHISQPLIKIGASYIDLSSRLQVKISELV